MINVLLGLCIFLASPISAWAGSVYDELTPAQKTAVQNGEQVFVAEDISGLPWPKAHLYQRVEATPEEAMAVVSDYAIQSSYIPGVKSSTIFQQVDARTTDVDYVIGLTVVLKENLRLRCAVSESSGTYSQVIRLQKADLTQSSDSLIRTEALGTGTLMGYETLVVPSSVIGGVFKEKAMAQVKNTVSAMVQQIRTERQSNAPLLSQQVQALRHALGQ